MNTDLTKWLLKGQAVTDDAVLFHQQSVVTDARGECWVRIAVSEKSQLDEVFALDRLATVAQHVTHIIEDARLTFSESILLHLTQKGLSREEAYGVVQRNAMRVWEKGEDFTTLLSQDETIKHLMNQKELEALFDVRTHLKHTEDIFRRVFGDS